MAEGESWNMQYNNDGVVGYTEEIEFFGDRLGNRNGCLRIMYNNVNGLKINEYMKSTMIDKYKKKKKDIEECEESGKNKWSHSYV